MENLQVNVQTIKLPNGRTILACNFGAEEEAVEVLELNEKEKEVEQLLLHIWKGPSSIL